MKKTKGKQKIEMKRVEDKVARLATLSKRKAGILKKIQEMVAQCGVEASFLFFTEAGKAHSFAHPSMEDAFDRVKCSLGLEPSGNTNTGSLVEAYKRQKEEELKQIYCALVEELEMVQEQEKKLKESESEWNIPNEEGSSVEDKKQEHQKFVEIGWALSLAGNGHSG